MIWSLPIGLIFYLLQLLGLLLCLQQGLLLLRSLFLLFPHPETVFPYILPWTFIQVFTSVTLLEKPLSEVGTLQASLASCSYDFI
jgi:hypothetical protein